MVQWLRAPAAPAEDGVQLPAPTLTANQQLSVTPVPEALTPRFGLQGHITYIKTKYSHIKWKIKVKKKKNTQHSHLAQIILVMPVNLWCHSHFLLPPPARPFSSHHEALHSYFSPPWIPREHSRRPLGPLSLVFPHKVTSLLILCPGLCWNAISLVTLAALWKSGCFHLPSSLSTSWLVFVGLSMSP